RSWMIKFLASLLDDKTDTRWKYGPDYDRQPIRICDEAAQVLAHDYLTGVRFEYEGNPAHLDEEIEKLKRVLAGEQDVVFAVPEEFVMPSDIPQQTAHHVVRVAAEVMEIYPFSTSELFWGGSGFCREDEGCGWETLTINPDSGKVLSRVRI